MPTTGSRFSRNARRPSWPSSLVRRWAIRRSVAEPVGPLEHELLRVPRRLRPCACAARRPSARPAASRSSATSWTSPIRSAVVGVEALAGDEVASRRARADLGQRERRDHRRDDPELDLEKANTASGAATTMSAARDEPAPAAERVALDARDHRRRARVDRLEHHPQPPRVGHVLLVAELDRSCASTRRRRRPRSSCPRPRARPRARRRRPARTPSVSSCDQRGVERVPLLRPRHRDAEEIAGLLDAQRFHPRSILRRRLRCRSAGSAALPVRPSKVDPMLRGALAAAVTPLRDDGAALDEEAFRPYLDFLARAQGSTAVLALGTTGEGILLSAAERAPRRGALPRRAAAGDRPLRRADHRRRPSRSPSTRRRRVRPGWP